MNEPIDWAMWLDPIALAASALMLALYVTVARARERAHPDRVLRTLNANARTLWVQTVMDSGRMDVLAIQTLRNSVMAASFMASTAILLIIGAFTITANIEHVARFWGGAAAHTPWAPLKIAVLLLDFALAFYQFSMAIRMFNHVGYMINVAPALRTAHMGLAEVSAMLNRGGAHYAVGMRMFFVCLPLMAWLLGPLWLVAGTAGLVLALWRFDQAGTTTPD